MLTWTKITAGKRAEIADRVYIVRLDGNHGAAYAAEAYEAGRTTGRPIVASVHRTAKAARAWCEVEARLRTLFLAGRRVA